MVIVEFPGNRVAGRLERVALRGGTAVSRAVPEARVVPQDGAGAQLYCSACAGPIEFGSVIRARQQYCSIECSLGGDRPA